MKYAHLIAGRTSAELRAEANRLRDLIKSRIAEGETLKDRTDEQSAGRRARIEKVIKQRKEKLAEIEAQIALLEKGSGEGESAEVAKLRGELAKQGKELAELKSLLEEAMKSKK